MYCSLKQTMPTKTELGPELRSVPALFGDAVALGDGIAADGGRLLLPGGGTYMIAFSGVVQWKFASSVEVRAVVAGDPRFIGPRAIAQGDRDVRRTLAAVRKLESRVLGGIESEHAIEPLSRQVTAHSVVAIPPGDDPVSVDLWAKCGVGQHDAEDVKFEGFELLAVRLGDGQTIGGAA